MRSVLIVDGDRAGAWLQGPLRANGYDPLYADSAEEAVAALREPPGGGAPAPVALVDARLGPHAGGVDLIPRLHLEQPDLVCALMAANLDTATAVAALRRGAYDFIEKLGDPKAVFRVLDRCFDRAAERRQRVDEVEALRVAKQMAEAASRGKSSFLATVSHELRTPLNAIIGFSEMMMSDVRGKLAGDQYRTYAADIFASGNHLLQIINDILDLSKAEAGKLELVEEVFDLRETIRAVQQLTDTRIAEARLTETVSLPPDLPLLRADARKTKQVLLNLVTNAVKFTPPGGQIGITCRFDRSAGIAIIVSDTGIGISPHDLGRVLRPFEQADSHFTRQQQGTGLGLPLVKAIMELHAGTLELRSDLGSGTEVCVTFPPQRSVFDPADETSRSAA